MARKKIKSLDDALTLPNDNDRFDAVRERIASKLTKPAVYETLRHGEKLVWQVTWLVWEVNNGGFDQYLTNSTGDYAQDTIGFLKDIGAKTTLKLLARIAKIFKGGIIPADQDERCDQLLAWEQRQREKAEAFFTEVNSAFYEKDESLAELAIAYVREHREQFA